ncbi:hypothetical protein PM082_007476 [Marasmius tenuissimus]|nr:hypothetical protein PM082_007476 [Marasmius tenuissimus]
MLLGEYAQYLDHPSVRDAPDYDNWDCREPHMNNDPLCEADHDAPLADVEEILSLEGLVERKEGDGEDLEPPQPDVPTAQLLEEADEGQPTEELALRATVTAGSVPSSVRDLRAAKRRRSSAASLPDTKKVRLAGNKENPDVDHSEDQKQKLVEVMMKAQKCGLTDIDALIKGLTPEEWALLIPELAKYDQSVRRAEDDSPRPDVKVMIPATTATSTTEMVEVVKTWYQVCSSMGLTMQEAVQDVRLLAPKLIVDCSQRKFHPRDVVPWLRKHGVSVPDSF